MKSVDRTNQKNVRLTIDPVVIDQRPEEKEPLSMDMSDSETISAVRQSSEVGSRLIRRALGSCMKLYCRSHNRSPVLENR